MFLMIIVAVAVSFIGTIAYGILISEKGYTGPVHNNLTAGNSLIQMGLKETVFGMCSNGLSPEKRRSGKMIIQIMPQMIKLWMLLLKM